MVDLGEKATAADKAAELMARRNRWVCIRALHETLLVHRPSFVPSSLGTTSAGRSLFLTGARIALFATAAKPPPRQQPWRGFTCSTITISLSGTHNLFQ